MKDYHHYEISASAIEGGDCHHTLASAYGGGINKALQVYSRMLAAGPVSAYRVTKNGKVAHEGPSLSAAVEAYNAIGRKDPK